MADKPQLNVVGTSPVRHDGVDKVTGRAIFGVDVALPGMLHARVLRSPHAHARITHIDTSAADRLPGVRPEGVQSSLGPIPGGVASARGQGLVRGPCGVCQPDPIKGLECDGAGDGDVSRSCRCCGRGGFPACSG